jgi:hypothetical protein
MVFMAASQIQTTNSTVTVHVNAATTVAAIKAGLSAKDGSGTIRGGTDAEKIATIVAANAAVALAVRDRIEAIPARLCHTLAASADPHECEQLLAAEIHTALAHLASMGAPT